jgi:drug/metabolite transporter (DMT)-like permease
MKTLGIILVVAGILMMVFRGVTFTREKKVVDIGPLEINAKEKDTLGWPIYAGAIATVAGVVLLVSGKRRS